MTTLPTSGPYADFMTSFFGTLSAQDQQSLWDSFLQNNNLTSNPSPTDITAQTNFMTFIQGTYTRDTTTILLSPEEVLKRDVSFNCYDLLLKMLKTLQATISVQAQNLVVLGNWQQTDTKQMTRVPTYTPNANQEWSIDTDFSKLGTPSVTNGVASTDGIPMNTFTIGYNDISIADISHYLVSQVPLGKAPLTPDVTTNSFKFANFFSNSDVGRHHLEFTFYYEGENGTNTVMVQGSDYNGGIPVNADFAVGTTDAATEINMQEAFRQLLTDPALQADIQAARAPNTGNAGTPSIEWPFNSTSDSDTKRRGEFNARDQQFIENIRSNRQVVQDMAQTQQNNLSTTQTAIQDITNLMTSMIDGWRSMIGSIFAG